MSPDDGPKADHIGLECLAEALFVLLREQGHFKRLDEAAIKAEQVLDETRQLLNSQVGGDDMVDGDPGPEGSSAHEEE